MYAVCHDVFFYEACHDVFFTFSSCFSGVEIHEGVGFESLLAPPSNQDEEKIGWRAVVSPPEHPVAQYEFNVLVGADGKRNTLEGFKRLVSTLYVLNSLKIIMKKGVKVKYQRLLKPKLPMKVVISTGFML